MSSITRVKSVVEMQQRPQGTWHVRVLVERLDGVEQSCFFKIRSKTPPSQAQITSEATAFMRRTNDAPIISSFPEMDSTLPADLVGLSDIPPNILLRIWAVFTSWIRAKFGRA